MCLWAPSPSDDIDIARARADHDVEEVLAIVGDFPQLPVVIDHCLYLTAKDPTTTQHTLQKLLRLAK